MHLEHKYSVTDKLELEETRKQYQVSGIQGGMRSYCGGVGEYSCVP